MAFGHFPLDSQPISRHTTGVGEVAYLSLGSNLGDRAAHLREAIALLNAATPVREVSSFYETQPVEIADQPWFLNCAVAIETKRTPREVLKLVLSIEDAMGRMRMRAKGPRKIDIDVVLFGDHVVDDRQLKIPHPAMHRRRFVLVPLAEIAPQARHPVLGKTASELLSALPPGATVRRLEPVIPLRQ